MTNFVESATLRVIDQSSGNIDKINRALNRLYQTAKRLDSLKLGNLTAASMIGDPRQQRRIVDEQTKALRGMAMTRREQEAIDRRTLTEGRRMVDLRERSRRAEERAILMRERDSQRQFVADARQARQSALLREREARRVAREERLAELAQRRQERVAYRNAHAIGHVGKYALETAGMYYPAAAAMTGALATATAVPRLAPAMGATIGAAAGIGGLIGTVKASGRRDLVEKQLDMLRYDRTIVAPLTMGGERLNWAQATPWATMRPDGRGGLVSEGDLKPGQDLARGSLPMSALEAAMRQSTALSGRYLNVSKTESLEQIKKLTTIMGDAAHALEMNPEMTRLTSFVKSFGGEQDSKNYKREVMAAIQSSEIFAAVNSPKEMADYLTGMTAMKVAYGDNARFTDYLRAQRVARASFLNQSESFRFGIFPALVQEYGPQAGVQMATAFRHVLGGKKWSEREMVFGADYGLFSGLGRDRRGNLQADPKRSQFVLQDLFSRDAFLAAIALSDRITSKDLGFSLFKPGADFSDLSEKGLANLYGKIDKKALQDPENRAKMREHLPKILGRMFGDRTAANQFLETVMQGSKLVKDRQVILDAFEDLKRQREMGDTGAFFNMKTLSGAMGSVAAQWDNLLASFQSAGAAIAVLNGVARALHNIANLTEASPALSSALLVAGGLGLGLGAVGLLKKMGVLPGNVIGSLVGGAGAAAGTVGTAASGAAAAAAGGGFLAWLASKLGVGNRAANMSGLGLGSAWQSFRNTSALSKIFTISGLVGAGSELMNGKLFSGLLTGVATLGWFFGPIGKLAAMAAMIAQFMRMFFGGDAANAATPPPGLAATQGNEGIKKAFAKLPEDSAERLKSIEKRAKELRAKGIHIDYKRSVVDLMRSMGVDDASFAARKKLYESLKKGERFTGTAAQNIWLAKWLQQKGETVDAVQKAEDDIKNKLGFPSFQSPPPMDDLSGLGSWEKVKRYMQQAWEYIKATVKYTQDLLAFLQQELGLNDRSLDSHDADDQALGEALRGQTPRAGDVWSERRRLWLERKRRLEERQRQQEMERNGELQEMERGEMMRGILKGGGQFPSFWETLRKWYKGTPFEWLFGTPAQAGTLPKGFTGPDKGGGAGGPFGGAFSGLASELQGALTTGAKGIAAAGYVASETWYSTIVSAGQAAGAEMAAAIAGAAAGIQLNQGPSLGPGPGPNAGPSTAVSV